MPRPPNWCRVGSVSSRTRDQPTGSGDAGGVPSAREGSASTSTGSDVGATGTGVGRSGVTVTGRTGSDPSGSGGLPQPASSAARPMATAREYPLRRGYAIRGVLASPGLLPGSYSPGRQPPWAPSPSPRSRQTPPGTPARRLRLVVTAASGAGSPGSGHRIDGLSRSHTCMGHRGAPSSFQDWQPAAGGRVGCG